jgi:hypothetical protein
MISLILILAIAVSGAAPTVITPPKVDPVGDCVGAQDRAVDLRKVMFLENRSLDLERGDETVRVTLRGERVELVKLGARSDGGIYSTNIGDEVEPADDLDVELKLAYVSGEAALYWKETYQHRIYRQGVFRFVGDRVQKLCEGRGGVNSSN